MTLVTVIALGALGFVVGGLIGCIGVGGILLVPALTYLGGMAIQEAIAVAMFSYIFTGLMGAALYARKGSIRWPMAIWLCLAAMPAAFAASWASHVIPGALIEICIAAFVVFAGISALRPAASSAQEIPALGRPTLLATGAVTGIGSALTGTGGPLVLLPLMIRLGVPILTAIGLAQAVQLPIATLATTGHLIYGRVDFTVGLVLAGALALGVAMGAYLAHKIAQQHLRRVVALVLIGVGCAIILKIARAWLPVIL
ncbi:MAG: sulfite exporter TauE/SafE family protein [Pseudomonadota bacterium]